MDGFDSIRMCYQSSIKRNAINVRRHNIDSFSNLVRDELEFGVKERLLLLHETIYGEKLCIQYPGKETKGANPDKLRPWDFRPKLLCADGKYLKDLSFAEIWDDIAEMRIADSRLLSVLAAVFFRMSLMCMHCRKKSIYTYTDVNPSDMSIVGTGSEELDWYELLLPQDILNFLDESVGKLRGVSIEAYLYYNDLLVQNEDCKYFYRDTYVNEIEWNSNSGRNNTLLSHISIIEYLEEKIKFSEIMSRFQRGMGVAPITIGRIPDVTNGIICL